MRSLGLFLALCSGIATAVAAPANFTPTFREHTVPALVAAVNGSENLRFGYVTVPEDRTYPANVKTIQLAVAILSKDAGSRTRDMTIYLAGGPGGSGTLRGFDTFFHRMAELHDVVLLDQRGTGLSRPNLGFRKNENAAAARRRFVSEGVHLPAINSRESAFDVEDVRRTLGYERMNVVGGSYGTFLAQQVNRWAPGNIRCSVFIGNIAPTLAAKTSFATDYQLALEALFRDVARTPRAAKTYRGLRRNTYALVRRLDRSPQPTMLPNPDTGSLEPVKVSGGFLLGTIQHLMETPMGIRNIPFLIRELGTRGPTRSARKLLRSPRMKVPRSLLIADGMYLSVFAQELIQPHFEADWKAATDVVRPALREYFRGGDKWLAADLHTWNLPIQPRGTHEAVVTDVPAFFVNGAMDTQTAPGNGAVAAAGYRRGFNFVWPRNGHHVGEESGGPEMDAILAFLTDPSQQPPIRLESVLRPDFYRVRPVRAELDRLAKRAASIDRR
jgi:pimeloyl-ACP methyl ester carboxylesterase